jgi:hypothetical protein
MHRICLIFSAVFLSVIFTSTSEAQALKPEMVFSSAMGEKIPLYSGVFTIQIPAQRQPTMPVTRVTLHYQACNDSMCLPPKEVTAELASDGAVK